MSLDLRALVLEVNQDVHGVPATVVRPAPEDTPIETALIWVRPYGDAEPGELGIRRRTPSRIAALLKADVPTVPIGTRITAAERIDVPAIEWIAESVVFDSVDRIHVSVVDAA